MKDPNFTGFKPFPDDHKIESGELIRSRAKYFAEGSAIGSQLIHQYTAERRLFYADAKEHRELVRNGFIFFVITCLLDWAVCVM
jgi:hypothetical protein